MCKDEQDISQGKSHEMWTVRDLAAFLKTSEAAVRSWILEKRVRYHKIGSLVRFLPDEIIADVKNNRLGRRETGLP